MKPDLARDRQAAVKEIDRLAAAQLPQDDSARRPSKYLRQSEDWLLGGERMGGTSVTLKAEDGTLLPARVSSTRRIAYLTTRTPRATDGDADHEFRAAVALVEEGDPECFLRRHGPQGIVALARADHPALPVAELQQFAPDEWPDEWELVVQHCNDLAEATYLAAEYMDNRARAGKLEALFAGETIEEARAHALAEENLNPAEIFLVALLAIRPRGYAAGSRDRQRDVELLRRRLRRKAEKNFARMVE